MADIEIRTCVLGMMDPGECCYPTCPDRATHAVLYAQPDGSMRECIRCATHIGADVAPVLATKPYQPAPGWEPRR